MNDGFLLIDKEVDWTSRDVCNKISHMFNTKKVGHTGTLDPFATGLLLVSIGKASKFIPYLENLDKTYVAELTLGIKTNTGDYTGEKVLEKPINSLTKEQIVDVDDGQVVLKPGMKLLKAFSYFEKDKDRLNAIQQKASMLIQENKVEGYLCLSVHPLDFLSASENTHNWRSCHALDGEFRCGNLSYMMDKSTVMCYLKSDEDACLPDFPRDIKWNSKKWRMYLYLSENHNCIMASRQYPFFSQDALNWVRDALFAKLHFSTYRWSPWYHDRISRYTHVTDGGQQIDNSSYGLSMNYYPIGNKLYGDKDIIIDGKNSQHFNDLLNSSCYTPWYCWRQDSGYDVKFVLGGEIPCLICGHNHIEYTDRMMCYDCACDRGIGAEDLAICDNCGTEFDENEGHWLGDDYVCPDCWYALTTECATCGDRFTDSDINYDEETNDYYCDYCYGRLLEKRRKAALEQE